MPLDFTAIDFETANSFKGSACAVAASKVRAGKVMAEKSWYIQPPAPHNEFDPRNVDLHGITPERVSGAAPFEVVLAQLACFTGGDLIAAHNAAFDSAVVYRASAAQSVPHPDWRYSCTLVLARASYNLPSYSLPAVAEAANVPLVHHHNPVEDARACAGILCDIAARADCQDLTSLHERLAVPTYRADPGAPAWLPWANEPRPRPRTAR